MISPLMFADSVLETEEAKVVSWLDIQAEINDTNDFALPFEQEIIDYLEEHLF